MNSSARSRRRRHFATLVALLAGIATARVAPASAEVVTTTLRAKLHARPAESSRVLTRVATGKRLKVLRRRGRWVRVRAKGQIGWLTRTSLRAAGQRTETPRPEGKRWIRKAAGWKQRTEAQRVSTRSHRTRSTEAHVDDPISIRPTEIERATPLRPLPTFEMHAHGSLGYSSLGMAFSSNGQQGLGNYDIVSSAVATGIGFSARARPTKRSLVEFATDYRLSVASPGIHYQSPSTGVIGDIAYTSHELNLRIAAGARASDVAGGIETTARVGYSYGAFVTATDNVGMLPSESLSGMTIGAEIAAPRASDALSIGASVDLLVAGTRSQTSGLGDGGISSASAWWATFAAKRRLSSDYELGATYRYQHSRTTWTGQSARQADVSNAFRIDVAHSFLLGASKSF